MRQKLCCLLFGLLTICCAGCSRQEIKTKRDPVVYVVCRENVIPRELKELILKEKGEAFHFTYTTIDYTYYVIGYGRQPGKGYKIRVKEFTMDKTHIYIDTTLIGVTKEHQKEGISFPYIVLKSQFYEKDVSFR